jgi:hypothetical protein
MAIQGNGTNHLSYAPVLESRQLEEDAAELRAHYEKTYRLTSSARWSQMLAAMRIFSIKEKLCNDALANEDFWKPAGGG